MLTTVTDHDGQKGPSLPAGAFRIPGSFSMASKPDTPCSACGKMLWSGSTSAPADKRMCLSCRRARVEGARPATCRGCGALFASVRVGNGWRRTCSATCLNDVRRRGREAWLAAGGNAAQPPAACDDCGQTTSTGRNQSGRFCPGCRRVRRLDHYRRKNTARRGAQMASERMTLTQLGDRDGWRCHLCGKHVNHRYRSPDPRSATFDHLTPVSHGGIDEPANFGLAHRSCNIRRGNRGPAQLLLFG